MACAVGYNTSTNGADAVADIGASATSMCFVDFGWEKVDSTVQPCGKGFYQPNLATSPTCSACSAFHATTSLEMAAILKADCDTCLPGYGVTNHGTGGNDDYSVVYPGSPCSLCTYGTYSLGIPTDGTTAGGQKCATCPSPADYTGAMVSRLVRAAATACSSPTMHASKTQASTTAAPRAGS